MIEVKKTDDMDDLENAEDSSTLKKENTDQCETDSADDNKAAEEKTEEETGQAPKNHGEPADLEAVEKAFRHLYRNSYEMKTGKMSAVTATAYSALTFCVSMMLPIDSL